MMSYTVRLLDPTQDRDGLLALWSANIKTPSTARYDAIYRDNVVFPIRTSLVYHSDEMLPVGSCSLFFRLLRCGKTDHLIGINFDMMVNRKHRTLGPALMVLKALMKESVPGCAMLLAMPNRMSQPI